MTSLHRSARIAIAFAFAVSARASAQGAPPADADSLPRFIRVSTEGPRPPTILNPATEPLLNRRIGIKLYLVSRAAAIQEISLASGIKFVYAADVLPNTATLRFQSDNIPVATALNIVLRGSWVDVAVGADGSLILLRKPPPPRPSPDSIADARAAEGAYELSLIRTIVAAASRKTFELSPSMGKMELGVRDLSAAPSPFEGDVFRALALLPGVEARNDYVAGLNVRGGESDQNLILLDGYPVYNPFHLFGLLGTFIEPMVGKADLITGAQPAQYGERLSSVLDVQSADANRPGLHGTGDVSVLAASATVGSTFADGGSWIVGGRHTYADVIANAIKQNSLPYGFSDLQGHLLHPVFGNAVLALTGYMGSDGSIISQNDGGLNLHWGNRLIGATLSKVFPTKRRVLGLSTDSVSLVQRASYTTFDESAAMSMRNFALNSSVHDARASGSISLFSAPLDLSGGYEVSSQQVNYSMQTPLTQVTNFLPATALDQTVTPVSGWLATVWRPSARLLIGAGARVDAVGGLGWTGGSPRISIKYFLTKEFAIVAAAGSYTQWLHSLLREDSPAEPLEFWIASNKDVPVSRATQGSLGIETWTSATRQLRVEAFYKKYSNLLETNPTADPSVGDNPFIALTGTSYGADVLIRQIDTGAFGGWISYSYAVSERVTPTGVEFTPGQDRRHELNAVGAWKFGRYRLSARLGLSTGTPYTPILGEFTRERYNPLTNTYAPDLTNGGNQFISGPLNSARMPFAQRVDLSITKMSSGGRVQISPYLSITNATFANNPAAYFYDYDLGKNDTTTGRQVPNPTRYAIGNLPFLPAIGMHIVF